MIHRSPTLFALVIAAGCSFTAPSLFATTIGINFVNNDSAEVQNGSVDSLGAGETAGAPGYAQSNWNNYGRYADPGIFANDNFGLATGVRVAWDAANTWRATGATPVTGDEKLMLGYLDSTGAVNEGSFTSIYANNANKGIVYLTGLSSWLAAQSAISFDVIIYMAGDVPDRVGEYWLQNASGGPASLTLGSDLTPHYFGSNPGAFGGTYDPVDATATSLAAAESGNYIRFTGIPATTDSFLIRTEEQSFRAPINGFQIVAVVPEPSTAALGALGLLGLLLRRRPQN